jgi:hypothetical protein
MTLCFSLGLFAQSYRGGVRGAVKDAGGATVPGAKVALIDVGTNVARNTVTNDAGEYVFNAVEPADYKVVVEFPGFKKLERPVRIGTQEFLTIDIALEVGDVTESIQVTEEVPLIETSNASTGQVVDRQKLVDLPNLGRNPFMMSKLSPNIVQIGNPTFNRMQDQSGSSQISIAGGPVRGNNYLVDGVPITDSVNRATIIPTIESVEEVKVQANTYDAEMGRTGGGVFNTYMKSGSNDWHGSAFGYIRPRELSANNFFRNRSGLERPQTSWENFGASIGGPLSIPGLYDGKNKTFFWLGYEGYNQVTALTSVFAVPTAAEREGNFANTIGPGGSQLTIFDPNTTVIAANGNYTRTPFANNTIPLARQSSIARNALATAPLPNGSASIYGGQNYRAEASLDDTADQFTAKLDHQLTSWWRVSGSYLWYHSLEPGENWFGTVSSPSQWTLDRTVNATAINNLITPDPTTVLSIRYGFNRFPNEDGQRSFGFNLGSLGFPSSFVSQIQAPIFPAFNFSTLTSLAPGGVGQTIFHSKNFLVGVSKFLGRHSVKFGFDYRRINNDGISFPNTSFSFDNSFTRASQVPTAANGADLASMLLGLPASGNASRVVGVQQFVDYYGGYVHDDFRINESVTLNVGLRYEYESGLKAVDNAVIVGFDRGSVSPIAVTDPSLGVTPRGGLMYAGLNGNPTQTGNLNTVKLSPRFGIAWKLNNKTTVRGGYGLFWAPVAYGLQTPLGWNAQSALTGSGDNGATPGATLANPYPNGLLNPVLNGLGMLAGVGQNVSFIDQNMRSPYVHQYSFDIQRELGWGVALAVGYVGSRGQQLTIGNAVNINQLEERLFSDPNILQSVPNPYFVAGGQGIIGNRNINRAQLLRPYNQFGNVQAAINSFGRSTYDSMVIKAQKRLSKGISFLSTFTWSQFKDTGVGAAGSGPLNSLAAATRNSYDIEREFSLSGSHTPRRWSNAVTYELPFGKGKPFMSGTLADLVVGGWSINAVQVWQTGYPLSVRQLANTNSQFFTLVQFPNATGVSPETSGRPQDRIGLDPGSTRFINAAAFSTAPTGTFGNLSRTLNMRGPGLHNWDISVFKTFTIAEKYKAQFRAEAVNAFNTPLFNSPNTTFGSGAFGQISQQANFPRMYQLGLRFFF